MKCLLKYFYNRGKTSKNQKKRLYISFIGQDNMILEAKARGFPDQHFHNTSAQNYTHAKQIERERDLYKIEIQTDR